MAIASGKFPNQCIVGIAYTFTRGIHVLLGGPGTGKTTKIAQDLVERFSSLSAKESWPRLGLAAPTGKAASRMTDVLRHRCLELGASSSVIAAVTAEPARTVHKLLDYNPSRVQPFRVIIIGCPIYQGMACVIPSFASTRAFHCVTPENPSR